MTRNDWEAGELTLPRAAIVPIRRELIKRNNEHAEQALALAKKVWSEATAKQKRDGFYLGNRLVEVGGKVRSLGFGYPSTREYNDVTERAAEILNAHYGRTPRPPQKQNAGILGATTTEFQAGGGARQLRQRLRQDDLEHRRQQPCSGACTRVVAG